MVVIYDTMLISFCFLYNPDCSLRASLEDTDRDAVIVMQNASYPPLITILCLLAVVDIKLRKKLQWFLLSLQNDSFSIRNIYPVFRGTLETYTNQIQRTPRLRIICESHKLLYHVGFYPTTLVAVESDVVTAYTEQPND